MADIPARTEMAALRDLAEAAARLQAHADRGAGPSAGGAANSAGADAQDALAPVVERVRADVAARRLAVQEGAAPVPVPRIAPAEPPPPLPGLAPRRLPIRAAYDLGELLAYDGEDFVANAYRAVLRREPDAAGLAYHLDLLYRGDCSKTQLLAGLRATSEGRAAAAEIRGLDRALRLARWRRLPVIGRLVAIAQLVMRLPMTEADLERHELLLLRSRREARATAAALEDLSSRVGSAIDGLADALERLDREKAPQSLAVVLTGRLAAVDHDVRRRSGEPGEIAALARAVLAATRELHAGLAAMEQRQADALQVREEVAAVLDRLETLGGELARLAAEKADREAVDARVDAVAERLVGLAVPGDPLTPDASLEDFYTAFEERFRGTREDIAARLAVYVPYVEQAGVGTPEAPVLDIGCGRGEWLEVLQATGRVARGVDLSASMVEVCRGLGLEAEQAEANAHLESLEPGSLGAVTAFQVLEHLSLAGRVRFVDAALRALRPGGLLIVETPNPENLTVGACTFWNDPTHRQPLPAGPLAATLEMRGFGSVEVLRLHEAPFSEHLPRESGELRDRLNHLLYGPQDYALVARKPGEGDAR